MFQFRERKHGCAMETGDHQKNGASSKSRMSRGNFKTMIYAAFMIAVVLFTFSSCGDDKKTEEDDYLTLDESSVFFDADGLTSDGSSSYDVYVETNMDFYDLGVFPSDLWCMAELDYSRHVVSIRVEPNLSGALLNTTVTVRGGALSETIVVVQDGTITDKEPDDENPDDENPCDYSDVPTSTPYSVEAVQNETGIVISWRGIWDATEYNIYRKRKSSDSYSLIGTSSTTEFVDDEPLVGMNYYRVSAVNCVGENPDMEQVSCEYKEEDDKEEEKEPIPAVLTGVTAELFLLRGSITISWNEVNGATGYKIYRSSRANGTYSLLKTVNGGFDDVVDTSPFSGDNYYKVSAYNTTGESAQSSYAYCNAKPPKLETPTELEAFSGGSFVSVTCNTVKLAYEYELYRSKSERGIYTKISAAGGSNMQNTRYTLTDSKPLSGTSYYKIKAIPLGSLNMEASDLSTCVSVTID